MCIISEEINVVSDTKILVAPNTNLTRQLIVYSNDVDNITNNNAMILPVPFPESVSFHDLTNYKNLFDDCESCFYDDTDYDNDSFSVQDCSNGSLKVFNVGSYQVSLAMSLTDILRVDSNVFTLSKGCYELLSNEYNNPNFGFIICKLSNNKKKYHPFGYSHNIFNDILFIPTKHYHKERSSINNNEQYVDDWSHDIYLYNTTAKRNMDFMKMVTHGNKWTGKNNLKVNNINFDLGTLKHFEKYQIHGIHKNIDLYVKCKN